jgi:hypothetical protein
MRRIVHKWHGGPSQVLELSGVPPRPNSQAMPFVGVLPIRLVQSRASALIAYGRCMSSTSPRCRDAPPVLRPSVEARRQPSPLTGRA